MDYGVYSRSVFNILDLFGTIGGILEIFMFVVELIMEPISEHAFICSAISSFYIIKHQSDEKFFNKEILRKNIKSKAKSYKKYEKNNEDLPDTHSIEEIGNLENSTYEKIKFSFSEKTWIFLFNIFCGRFSETECFKKCCFLTER